MSSCPEHHSALIVASQLRKARDVLQLTPEEVAEELNVGAHDVDGWERGDSEPSLTQLERLAELYGREIDYFLAETPKPPEKIRFRTAPRQALTHLSRDARVVLARFEELCRSAREVEGLLGKERTWSIPRFPPTKVPEAGAASIRERLGLATKPIPRLRDILERAGVRVFELPVPTGEFSGFSFWHSEYGPCILVNASDTPGRRNFTVAHELAHLVYGHESSVCSISLSRNGPSHGVERRANSFAVELLLPGRAVAEDFAERGYSDRPTSQELGRMSGKWGVSLQALGYRLEKLGLLATNYTDSIVEVKPAAFRGSKTPRWQRPLGKTFVESSFEAYSKGLISISKLAHSLNIPVRKAIEEVERRDR